MKKRLMSILLLAVMLVQLSFAGFANSVVFLDADSNLPITELTQHENVSARVQFVAEKAGDVQIYTIGYDRNGAAVKNALVNTITVEEGQEVDFTTASISTDGIDYVKVFVWDKATLSPIFSKSGVISSVITDCEGYSEKFTTEATEEAPMAIMAGESVTAGELFTAIDGAEINNEYFEISVTGPAQVTLDKENWADSTITFDGEGFVELTVQDYSFCLPTKAYVDVLPVPAPSEDARLKALSIEGLELAPEFAADVTAYTATVPYETEKVTVAATANDANATVVGTGSKDLVVGANTIEVVVTAEDGETTKTYTIVVTREPAPALDNISLNKTIVRIDATGNVTKQMLVDAGLVVTANYTAGKPSAAIDSWTYADGKISYTEDDVTKEIAVTIDQLVAISLDKAELGVAEETVVDEAYIKANIDVTATYTVSGSVVLSDAEWTAAEVEADVWNVSFGGLDTAVIIVRPELEAIIPSVEVLNVEYDAVVDEAYIKENVDVTATYTLDKQDVLLDDVVWTAVIEGTTVTISYIEDGIRKNATITIVRAAPSTDATLKALSIEGLELAPEFAADVTAYTATVPYETEKVTVAATTNDANATVVGTGEKELVVGANTIEVTVTAEDGTTTKTYTIVLTREPAPAAKFATTTTAEAPKVVLTGKTIKASDLFTAIDGADIKADSIEITATGTAQVTVNKDNWAESTITLSGEGVTEVTVQDNNYCLPTTAYVKAVAPVERYGTVFENTDTYLYRVGNLNTVTLSQLITEAEAELPIENIKVETATVYGTAEVSVAMNESNWKESVVTFSNTGVVSITISDDNSKPYTLKLEVVDAKNVTTAASATANSVVLLNDISSTGFTVSGGHTFYGNGFTVTVPATSTVQNKGAGFTGYVSIGNSQDGGIASGGNLDNVKIIGPVYPEMYIYRDQALISDKEDPYYELGNDNKPLNMRYFKNTVIVYGGDVTISNSYISGSRAAVYLGGGNTVIENTTLSGGAYANLLIGSAITVTLDNITTVQTDVADSYGAGKTAHGLGIAVDSEITDIYIEGELNQYNWLNKAKWDSIVPSNYQDVFPKFFTGTTYQKYWHYLNGGSDTYVNLGLIFACDWDTSKIHDNRTNMDVAPYATCNATIAGVSGGIYSKVNTSGNAITDADLAEPQYASSGYNSTAPVFSFDNSLNHDAKDESNAADTYCVYNASTRTLDIGITGDSKILDLSGVKVLHYGNELDYELYLNGTKISGNTVTLSVADGTKQTLTVKALIDTDSFDADGNIINIANPREYISWDIAIDLATLSFAAPEWNMGGTYTFDATKNCYFVYYYSSKGYAEAVPIYDGVKVKYYNKEGKLVERDLSSITTEPTRESTARTSLLTLTLDDDSILEMEYVRGWKSRAATNIFNVYNNKLYLYPELLGDDDYVHASVSKQNFDVAFKYTFTDPHGKSTTTETIGWYNEMTNNSKVSTVQWKTFDSKNGKSSCVTGDTLVTMADGSYKRIDEVTYSDQLLVWDFYNGEYACVPAAIISRHGYDNNTVIKLGFEDGTEVKAVNLHQFFDAELNKLVTIDADSVSQYVNHSFVKRDGNGYKTVKLTDYEISEQYVEAFGIVSAVHYNILVEDMFSADYPYELYDLMTYFEVGENLVYDKAKMEKDIEIYGLYTYDEFADYMTLEQFEAMNIKYMKISVGKGYYTYEGILALIEEYLK